MIIDTPVASKITKTYWFNKDSGFICGGQKAAKGYIYYTSDAGLNWRIVYSNDKSCLHDILFVNDSVGYACGENMLVLRTTDRGLSWVSTGNEINSDNFFNGILYGLFGDEHLLFMVGGRNFNVGIINWIRNNTVYTGWTGFRGLSNEMRCGLFFDSQHCIAMGYGTSYTSEANPAIFEPCEVTGDYFTACSKLNSSTCFACGFNGGIYKITQAGTKHQKIDDHNRFYKKARHFNSIVFISETKGWVCGNEGLLYSTTNGEEFGQINLQTSEDLLSVVLNGNNELIVSTSNGKLIRVPY